MHVCNKSISNYQIYSKTSNAYRFLQAVDYYRSPQSGVSLTKAIDRPDYKMCNLLLPRGENIKIYAYCIMPDHYHLLISSKSKEQISKYINNIENSFTRYLNVKSNRKGPLWQSPYRHSLIVDTKVFLHVSRYIHLNPTTSYLTEKPDEWRFSSYRDLISDSTYLRSMPQYTIQTTSAYKKFVESNIDRQRELRKIKKALLDHE